MLSSLKPDPKSIGRDTLAGLTAAITAIPDGMDSALTNSAVAIGIIGLVQAAGVSQGYPNPDG